MCACACAGVDTYLVYGDGWLVMWSNKAHKELQKRWHEVNNNHQNSPICPAFTLKGTSNSLWNTNAHTISTMACGKGWRARCPGLNSAILSILTQNTLQTTKASQSKQEVRILQPTDYVVSLCLQHIWFNKLAIFCNHEEATVITPSQHHVTTKQSTKAKNRLLYIKSSGHSIKSSH